MRGSRRLVWVAACVAVTVQMTGGTAQVVKAAVPSTITGAAEWDGTATLTTWPCPFSCGGTFTGSLRGTFTGIDVAGQPYTVTFPDPTAPVLMGNLSLSSWSYHEPCPIVPQAPPVTGSASGFYTASGGLLTDNGVVSHNASLTGQFAYGRWGVIVVVSINSGAVLNAGGQTVATSATAVGEGVGAFVPTTVLVPPDGTCLSLATSMTATVAGVISAGA